MKFVVILSLALLATATAMLPSGAPAIEPTPSAGGMGQAGAPMPMRQPMMRAYNPMDSYYRYMQEQQMRQQMRMRQQRRQPQRRGFDPMLWYMYQANDNPLFRYMLFSRGGMGGGGMNPLFWLMNN